MRRLMCSETDSLQPQRKPVASRVMSPDQTAVTLNADRARMPGERALGGDRTDLMTAGRERLEDILSRIQLQLQAVPRVREGLSEEEPRAGERGERIHLVVDEPRQHGREGLRLSVRALRSVEETWPTLPKVHAR